MRLWGRAPVAQQSIRRRGHDRGGGEPQAGAERTLSVSAAMGAGVPAQRGADGQREKGNRGSNEDQGRQRRESKPDAGGGGKIDVAKTEGFSIKDE